jgi:hypothetical protein
LRQLRGGLRRRHCVCYCGVGGNWYRLRRLQLGHDGDWHEWALYSAPRGNQYFRTLTKLDTVFKVTGVVALGVGTAADFYDAFNGDGSYGQAGLNLGIGVAGVLSPLYFVPGSIYFATSTLYPGGPAAYNAAYSQQLNAAEGGGP